MTKVMSMFLAGVALLLSAPAFAIDGQVLINQSTVMAAGGFPYKITQSGSYKLSGNLVVPAGTDGIDILADNVTLDLNGFNIGSTYSCTYDNTSVPCTGSTSGTGVYSVEHYNVSVTDGSITGFGSAGVDLYGSGEIIEGVRASQNGEGIVLDGGLVRHCTGNLNRRDGIGAAAAVVQDNETDENGIWGIDVVDATVTGNEADGNVQYGLGAARSVYGGNLFWANRLGDVQNEGGAISQSNNSCSATLC
jgi:hypothetical protein